MLTFAWTLTAVFSNTDGGVAWFTACIKRRSGGKERCVCSGLGCGGGLLVGRCRCSAMRLSSWLTQISWGKGGEKKRSCIKPVGREERWRKSIA
jgi:hypothetical protein